MSTPEYDVEIQDWSLRRALKALDITEVPFDPTQPHESNHGQVLRRELSVSHDIDDRQKAKMALGYVEIPILHTYLHEIAHVVLGHSLGEREEDYTPVRLAEYEVEAESTVEAVAALLDVDDTHVNRRGCQAQVFMQMNVWRFAVKDETGCECNAADIGLEARMPKIEQAASTIVAAGMSK